MDHNEFTERVKGGEKLVILDDLVLDVTSFIGLHPGGNFVLRHNIGRDISKFYYGGYSLEDNAGAVPAQGFNHPLYTRKIVNDLAIAKFDSLVEAETVICKVEKAGEKVNNSTHAFFMTAEDGKVRPHFKQFYPGTKMFAKHFLVRSLSNPKVFRHYTTCNAMNPEIYSQYLKLLSSATQSGGS